MKKILCCLMLLISTVVFSQVQASFFGVHLNGSTSPWPAAQVGAYRIWDTQTNWNQIETKPGVYNFTALDAQVNRVSGKSVDLLYTFGKTPSFYNTDHTKMPSDLADNGLGTNQHFKDFVKAVVARYGNKISYYEPWNEVNSTNFWGGTNAQLVRMAQDIKTIAPNAKVLTPSFTNGIVHTGDALVAYLRTPGASAAADVINVHGYLQSNGVAPVPENIVTLVKNLTGQLNATDKNKPLWIDETGWGNPSHTNYYDQDTRSAFVARLYLVSAGLGVSRLYWYSYDITNGQGTMWAKNSTDFNSKTLCGGRGVQETNGYRCMSGTAFREIVRWLNGGIIKSCQSDLSTGLVWTCSITRPAVPGYNGLVVWNTSGISTYVPLVGYRQYRTLTGSLISFRMLVQIGQKPILLENESAF